MNISKYSNIAFPAFGLEHYPAEIKYTLEGIKVRRHSTSHLESIPADFVERLINNPISLLDEQRLKFDYTCRTLQDLVFSRAKWCLDANSQTHDLRQREKHEVEYRLVRRIDRDKVWLKQVSYPFFIPIFADIKAEDAIYAKTVYIDNQHLIIDFSYEKENRKYVYL